MQYKRFAKRGINKSKKKLGLSCVKTKNSVFGNMIITKKVGAELCQAQVKLEAVAENGCRDCS